jgi:hypothetical protein
MIAAVSGWHEHHRPAAAETNRRLDAGTALRCRQSTPFPTFLIECLQSERMREEISRKTDTGTILDALNVRNISRLRFVSPPKALMEHFERVGRPLRALREQGLSESRTLATIRDALLPKLLSGEIRVKDPEKAVATAL